MKVLVFDTETTGLSKTKVVSFDRLDLWPYIVQFSSLLYDTDTDQLLKVTDYIIKLPAGIHMTPENTAIHGITNEISQKKGVLWDSIFEELFQDFKKADLIVAHNLEFDLNVLKVEIMRMILKEKEKGEITLTRSALKKKHYLPKFIDILNKNTNYYCTMQESVDLCNIKKTNSMGNYVKFPKLVELYQKLFEIEPKNLHNSLNDIMVCFRCFYKLRFHEDIIVKNQEINKRISYLH